MYRVSLCKVYLKVDLDMFQRLCWKDLARIKLIVITSLTMPSEGEQNRLD